MIADPTDRPDRSAADVPVDDPERGDVPGWVLVTLVTMP
jgi:hypothetical protein